MMEGWSSVPSTCIRAQPTYAKVEVSVSLIDPETVSMDDNLLSGPAKQQGSAPIKSQGLPGKGI